MTEEELQAIFKKEVLEVSNFLGKDIFDAKSKRDNGLLLEHHVRKVVKYDTEREVYLLEEIIEQLNKIDSNSDKGNEVCEISHRVLIEMKSQSIIYMDEIILSFMSYSNINTLLHSNLQKKPQEFQICNTIAKKTFTNIYCGATKKFPMTNSSTNS
jgi:hypothetical protein